MSDNYTPREKQELENAVVPENSSFYDEMNLLIHLTEKYPDDVELELNVPVSESRIDKFEADNNIKLPDELRALYMFADGLSLYPSNLNIMTLDEIEESLDYEWEWGDSKNYILLGDMIGDGECIFLDLDTGKIITNDHGDETEYSDFSTLLGDMICTFLENEVDDEELEEYISGWETSEEISE
ncbi:MAG: SMI1/KNR4 family protein [Ruminococcus sp.]|jgi:hypothetical protein|nr:SMI1/KNR4 family protein [Ruminococcus sp.]